MWRFGHGKGEFFVLPKYRGGVEVFALPSASTGNEVRAETGSGTVFFIQSRFEEVVCE